MCGFCGASRPAPRHGGRYICGVSPRTLDLGSFLGKRSLRDKKPNCIGFKPSNTDSEQGCRRQPCFFCSAHTKQHRNRPLVHRSSRTSSSPPAPAASAYRTVRSDRRDRRPPAHHTVSRTRPNAPVVRRFFRTHAGITRTRSSLRRNFETADFQLFAKRFKLCRQLTERK